MCTYYWRNTIDSVTVTVWRVLTGGVSSSHFHPHFKAQTSDSAQLDLSSSTGQGSGCEVVIAGPAPLYIFSILTLDSATNAEAE